MSPVLVILLYSSEIYIKNLDRLVLGHIYPWESESETHSLSLITFLEVYVT